jgi:hypothetical protein
VVVAVTIQGVILTMKKVTTPQTNSKVTTPQTNSKVTTVTRMKVDGVVVNTPMDQYALQHFVRSPDVSWNRVNEAVVKNFVL